MSIESCGQDILTIDGKQVPVTISYINQAELQFFPQNPRIYSLVYKPGQLPSQEEIEEELLAMQHVKQLRLSIEANGGLLEALIVRGDDMVVLEGNSRLAAYRILAKADPIKWGKVKCNILPTGIADDLIFALLGQIHIVGRKDWAPFEQAGYLWRRHKDCGVSSKDMSVELGLSEKRTNQLIEIYTFMVENNDVDPQHWSYWEEYFKSRKIQKVREDCACLDKVVVDKVKAGDIPQAIDIRHKVEKICAAKGKALKHFVDGKRSMDDCLEIALSKGVDNDLLNRLNKFRVSICDHDLVEDLKEYEPGQMDKCIYEIKKINVTTGKILKKLGISTNS